MTQALQVSIFLEEPLLLTALSVGEENSSVSLRYIPGGVLRGVCIAAYLYVHKDIDLARDGAARLLFFSGQVCFLNAYPALNGRRALPSPKSWHVDKPAANAEKRTIFDFAIEIPSKDKCDNPQAEKAPFYWSDVDGTTRFLGDARRVAHAHNASEDPMLKAAGTSTVFRYDALAAGQTLVAYVLADDESLLNQIKPFLNGTAPLGRSRTGGYGHVQITAQSLTGWPGEFTLTKPDRTTLTLLSDALLRDPESGQPTTDLHAVMNHRLGGNLPNPTIYACTQLVGGFNVKWGLPIPQQWALGMGSVYVYEGVDPERFKPLVSDGIGERRNEGFGRLAVNLNDDDSFSAHKCKPDLEIERGQLSFVGKKLAQDMATRRLKAAARNSVATYVSGTNFSKGRPTNAQLNCLRQLVQQAQARHEEKLDLISNHLDNLKKKAREQFDRYTLAPKGKGNPTWMEWLRERAANMDGLAQIGLSNTDPKLCVAGQLPRVDSTLSLQITCQLMDAILRKATKHKEQA